MKKNNMKKIKLFPILGLFILVLIINIIPNLQGVETNIPHSSTEIDPPTLYPITPNPSTNGIVLLSWSEISNVNYTLFRSNETITDLNVNITATLIAVVDGNSYNDSIITNGTYFYAVSVFNATDSSGVSNCESVQVAIQNLETPILDPIFPNPNDTGNIGISWSLVPEATIYYIYRASYNFSQIMNQTYIGYTNFLFYNDTIMTNGLYFYGVIASNGTHISNLSNREAVNVSIPEPPEEDTLPAPILNIISSNSSTTGIVSLNWSIVPGAIVYTIFRSISYINTTMGATAIKNQTETTFNDTIITNGIYYYAIQAYNTTHSSNLSNCESVQVSILVIEPLASPILSPISPNPSTTGVIHLGWTPISGAEIYTIYRSSFNFTFINGTTELGDSLTTNFTDTINGSGIYFYAVVAQNSNDTSDLSNRVYVDVQIESNENWQVIPAGIHNVDLYHEGVLWIRLSVNLSAETRFRLSYYGNIAPISPSLSNSIAYFGVEIESPENIIDVIIMKIFLNKLINESQIAQIETIPIKLYGYLGNWTPQEPSVNPEERSFLLAINPIIQYYCITLDKESEFEIPGYPLIELFFISGLAGIFIIRLRLRKCKY